jgi:hypothetical protein
MRLLLAVLFLALASFASGATKFVPANDSQPLIRRDLLPLDVDAIRELADHLTVLADGPMPKSASLVRHRAQTITLSQRLSPAQPRSRAIIAALTSGNDRPKPAEKEVKTAKRDVLAAASWLAKLPADSEGHRLGQLLLDILQPIAGTDSVLQLRNTKEAPQRWEGVIAKVTAFELRKQAIIPEEPVVPDTPTPEGAKYAVTALLTEVPMMAQGLEKGEQAKPGLVKTSLVITSGTVAEGADVVTGALRFQPDPGFPVAPLHRALFAFFKSTGQPLPQGFNLNVNTDRRRYLPENQENIAAPLAMMLDAALTGRTLRRNTFFFARLRPDGTLQKPAEAWQLLIDLETLRMPARSRIIVGQGMLEEMTALLVMEKVAFFNKYEVIEAPTFEAARALFYEDGKPSPDLAAAIVGYQEVREKANLANNLNTFLSLSTVESRLVKARDLSPQHLSARLMATQAIRRPAYFSRFMFAQELDRRLEEISRFQYEIDKTPDRAIKDAYKRTRETIDPLERRLQKAESIVLNNAVDIIKTLLSVGRGPSTLFDNEEIKRKANLDAFQRNLKAFRNKLRLIYQPAEKK